MSFISRVKEWRCKILLCHKKVYLGKKSTFGRGTVFFAPNRITIGNNVYIGKYCSLETDIEISDNVLIANNVGLIGKYDHDFSTIGMSIKDSPCIRDDIYNFKGENQKIVVEEDTWIGYGSIIFSGITVGKGSIVAAGSVVLKDVKPYSIVAGNPAKIISWRFNDSQIKEHEEIYYSSKSKV